MRKLASVLVASILLAGACSGSSATLPPAGTGGGGAPTTAASQASNGDFITPPPIPSNAGACTFWCGNGSAQVTVGDTTVTMSPGGCYPASDNDVDARFGDFVKQKSDWIIVLVYYGGSKTPILSGSIGGKMLTMSSSDATGTIGKDGKGSISGTEFLGTATISVAFSCT